MTSPLTFFITGASRGIGLGMAEYFAAQGHRIAGCARRKAPALFNHSKHQYRAIDLTDPQALLGYLNEVWQEWGPIDVLINNAAILPPIGAARDLDSALLGPHLALNLETVFAASSRFLALWHQHQPEGSTETTATMPHATLINISSGAAKSAYQGWSVYCASKAAIDQFSNVVAAEERPFGHRIHSLAPGVVDTDMQSLIRQQNPEEFEVVKRLTEMKEQNPQAFNSPEQSAKVILDLATNPQAHHSPNVDIRRYWSK